MCIVNNHISAHKYKINWKHSTYKLNVGLNVPLNINISISSLCLCFGCTCNILDSVFHQLHNRLHLLGSLTGKIAPFNT